MEHIIRVDKLHTEESGRPIETEPQGYIINDDWNLFPYLTKTEQDATAFSSYDEAINFVSNHLSELMANKKVANWEYTVTIFELTIHMVQV